MIYENSKRNKEEVEAIRTSIQKALYEEQNYPTINCRYNENLDQFIAYCFVDRNDDDDLIVRMNFDYDEAIALICDLQM
jgi:hypothetical protein